MNQPFDAGIKFNKRTEVSETRNGAAHPLAWLELFGDSIPGMRLQLLRADRDAMFIGVDLA